MAPLPRWAERARAGWQHRGRTRPAFAHPPGPGQESVWDYPRPARAVDDDRRVVVELDGIRIAETRRAIRVLETSHPPTFYLPRDAIRDDALVAVPGESRCEWKGVACYYDVVAGSARRQRAAWSYEEPFSDFVRMAGHVGFYPSALECYVDDERVRPQPGGFYAGWITDDLAGPFKGAPGSGGW